MENREIFLNILKAALAGQEFAPEMEITTENWAKILDLARQHQLLPMILEASYRAPGLAGTPLLDRVRKDVRQQVFLQARKTGEFLTLYRKLQDAGIKPLVVKGIICRNLYLKPDQRMSSDEDVLIPPEQFARCHELLLEHGMETAVTPEQFDKSYEVPYTQKGAPLYIELHKSLFPGDSDAYSELNSFFERVHETAVAETVEGTRILTMASTDHLFYLICHAFKHFLHGGFGIRQVCDIVLYARHYAEQIDWNRVLENCRAIRADRFAGALFTIGERHLDLPVSLPEIWRFDVDERPMLEDLLSSGIYGKTSLARQHSSNITLNAVIRRKRGKDSSGGVLKSLFPRADALENRYPYLKKHPVLLPVAWISRIGGFATKGGSSRRAVESVRLGNERVELLKHYGIIDD